MMAGTWVVFKEEGNAARIIGVKYDWRPLLRHYPAGSFIGYTPMINPVIGRSVSLEQARLWEDDNEMRQAHERENS